MQLTNSNLKILYYTKLEYKPVIYLFSFVGVSWVSLRIEKQVSSYANFGTLNYN